MAGGDEETARLWKEFGERLARSLGESAAAVSASFRPAFERAGLGEQFRAYEEELRLLQSDFGSRLKGRALEAAEAGAEYARAFQSLGKAGAEALRLFWEKGKAVKLDPGKPDETLRALHEAWLGAYNESMRTYFLSDDFGRALGRFLEVRTEVDRKTRDEGEKVLKSLGAPTRSELDSVHKRILEIQRRIDQLAPAAMVRAAKTTATTEVRKRGKRR